MIQSYIGKKVKMRAVIGAKDNKLNKVCLTMPCLEDSDGKWTPLSKDHLWFTPNKNFRYEYGKVIQFTCSLREYVGLDEDGNQCKKIGIHRLRNIKGVE